MECKAKHSTAFLCLRLSPAASMLLRGPGLLAQIPALGCFAMASYYLKYLYQRFCGSIIFMLWFFFPFHKQQGFRHPNRLNLRYSATPLPWEVGLCTFFRNVLVGNVVQNWMDFFYMQRFLEHTDQNKALHFQRKLDRKQQHFPFPWVSLEHFWCVQTAFTKGPGLEQKALKVNLKVRESHDPFMLSSFSGALIKL